MKSVTSIHNPLRTHHFAVWQMRRFGFGGRWVCPWCHKPRRWWRRETDKCPAIAMSDPTNDAPERVTLP